MAKQVSVIIPAFNEEKSIGKVVTALREVHTGEVIVVNNGSTDDTSATAARAGAVVLEETKRGYGNACLKGIAYLTAKPAELRPEVVVFLDGDFSDYPEELPSLTAPIFEKDFDLVIGSRVLGVRQKGSLTPQQVFGNWLATTLVRWMYKVRFTDLGPFRAIRFSKLLELEMKDPTYGWTVEMQVKAAKLGLRCTEVAVSYRKRIGISKVSGTLSGSVKAGYKILWTIFKLI